MVYQGFFGKICSEQVFIVTFDMENKVLNFFLCLRKASSFFSTLRKKINIENFSKEIIVLSF